MALQGSITFKGLIVPKAYLDIHKIVIDVESMSANMEYKSTSMGIHTFVRTWGVGSASARR